ncbi:MAG: hypothetical protein HY298_14700 [Verrucomicrobia bacterium]|nr:hypothetical protein [Verrucomicrobiota bacterium]
MSSYLDKLNLRPQERRLLVAVAAIVFIVLNIWLVWPHFKDWGQVKSKMREAQRKLETYQTEVKKIPEYEARVKSLMGDEAVVLPEDQAIQFLSIVRNQAAQNGVVIVNNSRVSSRTNESFVEQTQQISVQSGEKQLVNFLYSLGTGNSMIRVKDLSLRPEANRMSLGGNVTLVASYQRNVAAKPTAAAPPTTQASKPTPATEKRAAPPEKRSGPTTNRVASPTDRRPKPTDKPTTSTNKRS